MIETRNNEAAQNKTKHRILYDELLQFFLSSYQPGDMLPTEKELLDQFQAGRGTLRTALNRLAEKGIILRIPGRGTFLSEQYQVGLKRYRAAIILSEQEFADTSVWEYTWYNNMEMINGALKEALQLNLAMELVPESAVMSSLGSPYDGYLAFRYIHPELLESLDKPVEQIAYDLDIADGLRKIVENSISLGVQRPAFIGNVEKGRLETVQDVLSAHGLPPIPGHRVVPCSGTIIRGYEAAKILAGRSDLPDCIYCSTDLRALGVLKYLQEQNIQVPEDIMVYGFDGTRISQTGNPPLTTCAFDWQYFGRNAVRRIRSRLDAAEGPELACIQGHLVMGGTTPVGRKKPDREAFIRDIRTLAKTVSVDTMSGLLQAGADSFGLDAAMEGLHHWSLHAGYLKREMLEENELISFYDQDYEISFQLQLSHARKAYIPRQDRQILPKGARCQICREIAGSTDRELLRTVPVELTRPYFLQLTPFPIFPRHFVLIDRDHTPMLVDRRALEDIFIFLDAAPEYTLCSNSDKAWAGASILEHMHFQVSRRLDLPVFSARPSEAGSVYHDGLTIQRLDYPIAALRLISSDSGKIISSGGRIIEAWKKRWKDNTVNLAARIFHGRYELYIIFRNPGWRNPRHLVRYKSEGVGVVEVCGLWIFPPPDSEEIVREIRSGGRRIIREFFAGLNPVVEEPGDAVSEIVSTLYQER